MIAITKEQIREIHTVPDMLRRYGVDIRAGRCKGFCHNGKDRNMVVSKYGAHCFVCNKNFDVFGVVMFFENCTFREAFEMLGGKKPPCYSANRRAEKRRIRELKLEAAQRRYDKALAMFCAADYIITLNRYEDHPEITPYYNYALQNISRYEYELEESEVKLFELRKAHER